MPPGPARAGLRFVVHGPVAHEAVAQRNEQPVAERALAAGRTGLGPGSGVGAGVIQLGIDAAFAVPFLHPHHLAHLGGLAFFGCRLGAAVRRTAGSVRRRCLITHGHALRTG